MAEWFSALAFLIQRSWVQDLHPSTGGICFSVVPSLNTRSRFENSPLVCYLPVRILNNVTFIGNISFFCLSGMLVYVAVLTKLSACLAKRTTTISKICIFTIGAAKESGSLILSADTKRIALHSQRFYTFLNTKSTIIFPLKISGCEE